LDFLEGIELEALAAYKALRQGVINNAGNQAAVEALMSVADPVANIARATTAALSKDVSRGKRILDEAQSERKAK
jgi:hypothetical protein